MGILDNVSGQLTTNPFEILCITSVLLIICRCIYRCTFHPLAHIPGPLLPKLTSLWLYYHSYIGDEATVVHEAHNRYGPLVRVSPHEVDIADADAIAPVYISKGGFPKAAHYANFDIDGHRTIFSSGDDEYRAVRAKAVLSMFSKKRIKDNEAALYNCVDGMTRRIQEVAKTRQPVDILDLAKNMALDATLTHLFMGDRSELSKGGIQLSAPTMKSFLNIGRFFYLPNIAFPWFLWLHEKLHQDRLTKDSSMAIDRFVDDCVESTQKSEQTYSGRLAALGLSNSEIKAQCKDVIVAGTDFPGLVLATICWHLVQHPEQYEKLHNEVISNSGPEKQEVQSLTYLSAVVKEGLRISVANPSRLPRVVPRGGWTFKSTHFPAGSIIGCSAYELHSNQTVFSRPAEFQPERWLEGNITPEANKYWFVFGAGIRQCIARNLATAEVCMAVEKIVESDVLRGARVCQDSIELYQWPIAGVKGEKIELITSGCTNSLTSTFKSTFQCSTLLQ